ncbi:Ig-like protein group 3 [Natranaerovirga hydrolytica]|uniref:Ig-like protein group 3 n=1 Tax=Natranaerovirga hydrolytica TaxID=680378 RepID=A0A4R1MZJ5_9FIRM|nr:bacterial Ig-like domain-containing protein [Natranaerovirga hydrolytica]TCK98605.1 Ig-like protein group 3 [Natranaerovirga hydrolytica]
MSKFKRVLGLFLSLIMIVSSMTLTVFAEETSDPFEGMINIAEDSLWQGSVFGDIGGQDDINSENFDITENEDGTVNMSVKDNRGKVASTSDGLAYYYQEVSPEDNFELKATMTINDFTLNNQVSFGLMVRDEVLENENTGNTFGTDYVAAGAYRLGDDNVEYAFAREGGSLSRPGVTYTASPVPGDTIDISIQKSGNTYVLTVGDEDPYIFQDFDFEGDQLFAGLYVIRNADVTFSNVSLNVDGEVELGDWADSFFGDIGGQDSIDPEHYEVTPNDDGTLTMRVSNNKGKIAGSSDGLAMYYKEVPADVNFIISAKAQIVDYSINNQVAFGLMIRDEVLINESAGNTFGTDYIAAGAYRLADDRVEYTFARENGSLNRPGNTYDATPIAGDVLDISIQKSGNTYVVDVEGQETVVYEDFDFANDTLYAGMYVVRNAEVIFSDYEITVDTRSVVDLDVDTSHMKSEYLLGEQLELDGIEVTVHFNDGSTEVVGADDIIVTGFDSSQIGTNTININYNGVITTTDLEIVPLSVSELTVKYLPAKTDYYIGDTFNPLGLTIEANYNDGYEITELDESLYTISIEGQSTTGSAFVFETAGIKEVEVRSTETTSAAVTFDVEVSDAVLEGISIEEKPAKTAYFVDDELDISGIVVYANYSGENVRLLRSDFEVTGFDSTTLGELELEVSYKGETATFEVNVKYPEIIEIEVTEYPKTTYYVGEDYDLEGLVVSTVKDDGERATITGYEIDTTAYDKVNAGVYDLIITFEDYDAVRLPITVREEVEYEWKEIIFGQSISEGANHINVKDDHVEIIAYEGGGKITGDHDGISFYYVELDAQEDNFTLSADIKVNDYAKTPHDGQESFGIMARDAIGTHMDSGVFSSNIASVGGYSGGTRNPNGTQLFLRSGVLASDGEGSLGVQSRMILEERPVLDNTYPAENYNLTLSKTNSGFTGSLNGANEQIIFEPEVLQMQDNEKMYVGFYSARLAEIEVYNIDLEVTAASTDAPREYPEEQPVSPTIRVESLNRYSETDYDLMLDANVDGTVTVKQGADTIISNEEIKGGEIKVINTEINDNDTTNFSIAFIPDDTQYLTSYDMVVRNFTVEMRTYQQDGDIYVAPAGTSEGDGSIDSPLDIHTAIDFVQPGQTIIALEGQYILDRNININKYNDGREDEMKKLIAEEGKQVIFDADRRVGGVIASGNYWHIKGIDFARSAGNSHGFRLGGSHNVIELCNFYENGETGLQISRTDGSMDIKEWPSYNTILNSTSYANRDPSENNADGFAAKLTSGYGNVFDGCISYNNIDDGWDLYTKVGEGVIGEVTIRNSVSFNNGYNMDGSSTGGHGIGFKLGGEGVHVQHVIEDSIAFGNKSAGFSSNSNPGIIVQGKNIAFNNHGSNLDLRTYSNITPDFSLDGFISFHYNNPLASSDNLPAAQADELRSDTSFLWDGTKSVNASGDELTINNFNNLVMPETINRLPDGSINFSFLEYDPDGNQNPHILEFQQ